MNKLQLFAATSIMLVCTCACNTTQSKSDSADKTIEQAAKVTPEKSFDNDFIMKSALEGKIETIKGAVENGFNVNTLDKDKRTALMLAAYNGHNEIVQLLIAKGADVNLIDNIQRTALMYASTGPFVPTVLSLLQSGAKPNMVDSEENWTAVMMAAAEGQLEVVKVLVSNGADLKMVDVDGESSLDFAKSRGHTAVADYIKTQVK